jgi:vacuolar-type H+-ATPase subunit E/Vma4
MGLEQLLDALERDAGAEIERVLAAGRAEADRIATAAAADRDRRRRAAAQDRERQQRELSEHGLGDTRRAARRTVLEAQHALLQRVFQAVRARLPAAAASPAFGQTLPDRLKAALAALGDEAAVIHCTDPLASSLKSCLPGKRATIVADLTCGSGFTVATGDGAVLVDETLEARLERQRSALARLALDVLEVGS